MARMFNGALTTAVLRQTLNGLKLIEGWAFQVERVIALHSYESAESTHESVTVDERTFAPNDAERAPTRAAALRSTSSREYAARAVGQALPVCRTCG